MNSPYLYSVHPLKRIADVALVLTVSMFLRPAGAGDLNPPVGPIAPTMKNLDTMEPRIPLAPPSASEVAAGPGPVILISAPGSYFLTGNLAVPAGVNGIEIAASDVTLDLNGFPIAGVAGSLNGIIVTGLRSGISVFNGEVSGVDQSGVDLSTAGSSILRDLRVRSFNNGSGTSAGIRIDAGGTVTGCTVSSGASDATGIEADRSLVTHCTVVAPGDAGIRMLADGGRVSDCFVWGATQGGIVAGNDVTIANNTVGFIIAVSVEAGIDVGTRCLVVGNTCVAASFFPGNGIRATGSGNRIEGNNVVFNGGPAFPPHVGIQVTGTGNLITKNSVTKSPAGAALAYDIAPGNAFGPIVVVAGVGAFFGADPWANLEY